MGGLDDPLAGAFQEAGANSAVRAPDAFLQLRNCRGYQLNGESVPARWILDGHMRIREGQLEITSAGLNLSEEYSQELNG